MSFQALNSWVAPVGVRVWRIRWARALAPHSGFVLVRD